MSVAIHLGGAQGHRCTILGGSHLELGKTARDVGVCLDAHLDVAIFDALDDHTISCNQVRSGF